MEKITKLKLMFFIYPILASLLSFSLKANFFLSALIFLAVPSLMLSFINRNLVKKSALFSALFGIPMTFMVDYLSGTTGTWFIPHSIFPSKLLGVVTIDMLIWGFFYLYFIVMYYEYFIEHKSKDRLVYPRMNRLITGCLALLFIFSMLIIFNSSILNIRYLYFKMGIVLGILPVFAALIRFPSSINNFLKTGLYFSYFNLVYETTALKLGHWTFPGNQYIAFVNIFGVKFPFEEFFFWILLGAISVLSFYKFFDNK